MAFDVDRRSMSPSLPRATKTQFPGGYPNDAGVNIQHDDFFGARQPETQAQFDLVARERPDLTMNMHTGASFVARR